MKKLLALLLVLTLAFAVVSVFPVETAALGDVLLIYETGDEIVIDGKKDFGYDLISSYGDKKDENWVTNPDLHVDGKASLYACWDKENLYLYVEVPCNEEHISYQDDGQQHWIFNGHHCMWALLPDNPYQDKYYGDLDDGRWSWSALNNAAFMYEWTTICDSNTGETHQGNHFRDITQKPGYECVCTADGKKDTYEVKIPLAQVVTPATPDGIPAEDGSLFGFGFRLGLIDVGFGYGNDSMDEYRQCVQYSDYFTGDKFPQGLAYAKLVSNEAREPVKIKKKYEVFPSATGMWQYEDNGGSSCSVKVSKSVATIKGSKSGNWPSAYVDYKATLLVDPEKTYLVYDIEFKEEVGAFSIRFNDEDELNSFITDNIEPISEDMLPGHYTGYVSFKDIAEEYGKNDKGYYEIKKLNVFSVNGSEVKVNTFNIDPTFQPPEEDPVESSTEPEPVESSEEPEPVESSDEPEPVESSDEPAPVESSDEPAPAESTQEPAESTPEESAPAEESKTAEETPAAGFPWWGWLLIGVGCLAVVGVVLGIVLGKKKKA